MACGLGAIGSFGASGAPLVKRTLVCIFGHAPRGFGPWTVLALAGIPGTISALLCILPPPDVGGPGALTHLLLPVATTTPAAVPLAFPKSFAFAFALLNLVMVLVLTCVLLDILGIALSFAFARRRGHAILCTQLVQDLITDLNRLAA